MAELPLTVYRVDGSDESESESEWEERETQEKQKKQEKSNGEQKKTHTSWSTSWRDWLGLSKQPKKVICPAEVRKGGTDYSDAKVVAILKDYLQPTTTLSEADAFKSIMALIPSHGESNAEVANVSSMVIELAEQIHFDHPSHFKLAWLVRRIGSSPKFTSDHVDFFNVCQLLGEYIYDQQTGNDEDYRNVNIVAFNAKLSACGLWCGYRIAAVTLRYLFEDKRNVGGDAVSRSGCVMEGAVWILFYGYMVYQMVLQDKEAHRWAVWRDGFVSIETEAFATDECKKLSARAVKMMDALTYVP